MGCRKPYQGINFIIAHDGFTLYDLVAYNGKHNDANGEGNRDGSNDNFSWNCGQEGETEDAGVNALRQRQMRNMMLALMVSQGTPMVLMGKPHPSHTTPLPPPLSFTSCACIMSCAASSRQICNSSTVVSKHHSGSCASSCAAYALASKRQACKLKAASNAACTACMYKHVAG